MGRQKAVVTAQVSMKSRVEKHTAVHPYDRILLSDTKEHTTTTCNDR